MQSVATALKSGLSACQGSDPPDLHCLKVVAPNS